MDCRSCGFENDDGSRFCGSCGDPFEQVCGHCQATVRPGLNFCNQCGSPVGAAPLAAAPGPTGEAATLVAQRKTITVVFGDVGGSTGLGERLDPEAAREVMNRYHLDVLEVIGEHGGTVDKFNGDGFMATFGIPEVSEDDAANAVEAAVEIQGRFGPFAATVHERHGGEPITLRIGVNTGEIVIAEGDPDIIGDALNVAARLERACPAGGVLVGPETWRLTRGAWSYEAQGEVTVAGRVEPVDVYLVEEATADVETATPFVGRDRELELLLEQRDLAVETHSLRLVNVIGSPGLGKSRLAREVAAGLDFEHRHTVSCERAGTSTFAPVIDLVRSVAGVGPTVSPEAIMAALRNRFADVDFADREAERLHDAMAGLVGAGPIRSTEESFWAVRRLVELIGREGPTLIVVDDIQWAEPVLLDLLEHLAEWVAGADVVLLCLARPEIRDLRPSLTEAGRRADAVIALEGLDAAATAALAQRMLGEGELPAALIERIPTSTEGNPLFVRELVKMLVADGVIERRGAAWELTIDAEAVEVPPTIASLLAARIDRLHDAERIVLERAAVIGPEFADGALRAIAGDVPGGLSTVLERLRRMELVEPTGSYWGDHPVHRFHHVLIRDAAYRRLLKGTRADLHQQVAGWLETASEDLPGNQDEVIAFHEEQAYRFRSELGPLDDTSVDVGRRASARLAGAAARALARDDLTAAGPLAMRALDCVPAADGTRGELLLVACEALLGTGDVGRGEVLVDELDAIAPDDRLRAWAACFRAQLTAMTEPDRLPEAEQEATSAATVLEALRDDAGAAKGHLTRARILVLLGRVGEAESELDLALTAAREADDARRITAVLGNAPLAALWGPSPVPRAGGRCLDIVRLLRITTRAPAVEATSMRCQALLEALRGRFDTARTMIARCRRKVDELGLRLGSLETELVAGQVELLAGDLDAAETALRTASTGLTAMRLGAEAGQATSLLARVLVAKGEVGEADVLVGTAEQMAGRNLKSAVAWRLARAEVLLARGDADVAVATAQAAVDVVADTDLVVDQTDAELVLARALTAAGDVPGATAAEQRAKTLAEAKGASALIGGSSATNEVVAAPGSAPAPAPAGRREVEPWRPKKTTAAATYRRLERATRTGNSRELAGCFHPDSVWNERRPLFAGRFEIAEMVESMRPVTDAEYRVVLCSTDRVVLVTARYETQEFTNEMLQAARADAEGRIVVIDSFELGEVDAALDRYFELVEEDAAAAGEALMLNDAIRVSDRVGAHVNLGDVNGALAHVADDVVYTEHRHDAMGLAGVEGREAMRTNFEAFTGVVLTGRGLAVHGAQLGLQLLVANAADFFIDSIVLIEVDDAGLQVTATAWDLADVEAAFAEFERRAAVLDTPRVEPWDPEATTVGRTSAAVLDAVNGGDHELHRTLYTDDFIWRDHRRLVNGTFDLDGLLSTLRPIERMDASVVLCGVDRVEVVAIAITAQDFSHEFLNVHWSSPDGPYLSIDTFDLDDLDTAIDRYHEVLVADAEGFGGDVATNNGARMFDRIAARLLLGDIDGIAALLPEDATHAEWRQTALGMAKFDGREAVLDAFRSMGRPDVMACRIERTAGEHLVLQVCHFEASGFPFDFAILCETEGERVRSTTTWDLADWDDAVAEFERCAAMPDTGGPAIEPWDPETTTVMRAGRRLQALLATGEDVSDELGALMTEDMVYVDHRPLFAGEYTCEQSVAGYRGVDGLQITPVLCNTDRVALTLDSFEMDGNVADLLALGAATPHGLIWRTENFEIDDLDAAVDRYHELVLEDAERFGGRVVANAASHLADRVQARLSLGRTHDIGRLVTEEMTYSDQRKDALGLVDAVDRNATVEVYESIARPDSMASRTVRTAGETLALRVAHQSSQGFPFDYVLVFETDGTRATSTTLWDLDDWEQAVAEFERRASAKDVPPVEPWDPEVTSAVSTLRLWERLTNEGEHHRHPTVYSDEVTWVDHRPMFAGTFDAEEKFRSLDPVQRVVVRPILVTVDRVALAHMTLETMDFGSEVLHMIRVDRDGTSVEEHTFDLDQIGQAVDTYHRLVADDADRFGGAAIANAASRLQDRNMAHLAFGDVESTGPTVASDIEQFDHRVGFGAHHLSGWHEFRSNLEAMSDGVATLFGPTIQVSGDRLALQNVRWIGRDYRVDMLLLMELDAAGRGRVQALYDLDQHDEAIAEFERRAAALDDTTTVEPWDPRSTTVWRAVSAMRDAFAAGDHAAARTFFADDLVWTDHREGLRSRSEGDILYELWTTIDHADVELVLCGADQVAVLRLVFQNRDFEIEMVAAVAVDPQGRCHTADSYSADDLDAAVDRYFELVVDAADRDGDEALVNGATRGAARLDAHGNLFGFEDVGHLMAEDFELHDYRRLIDFHLIGREAAARGFAQTFPRSAEPSLQCRILRAVGDRVALRVIHVEARSFETDVLAVVECDEAGVTSAWNIYDLDRYDEAVTHVERRAAELDVAAPVVDAWDPEATSVVSSMRAGDAMVSAGDLDGHRALLSDGSLFRDHRRSFEAVLDVDAQVESARGVGHVESTPLLVSSDRVCLFLCAVESGGFEVEALGVRAVDADARTSSVDLYDLDQVDESVDRYHEVVADDAQKYGETLVANEAGRAADRLVAHGNVHGFQHAADLLAPGVAVEDRRRLFVHGVAGREALKAYWATTVPDIVRPVLSRVLRVAGDRLCLRYERMHPDGFVIDYLNLWEIDEAGEACRFTNFDTDAMDEAVAELERRAAEIDPSTIERFSRRVIQCILTKDRAGQRALCADEMVFVDHRPLFAGTYGPDEFVDSTAPVEDLSYEMVRSDDDRSGLFRYTCVTQEFTIEVLNLIFVATDGRITRLESFDIDDLDAAVARYDEIVAQRSATGSD